MVNTEITILEPENIELIWELSLQCQADFVKLLL